MNYEMRLLVEQVMAALEQVSLLPHQGVARSLRTAGPQRVRRAVWAAPAPDHTMIHRGSGVLTPLHVVLKQVKGESAF